jgi:hypothetical protein
MNVKLIRSYRSKNGNATFVYGVSGNATDLDAYKVAQGDFYREDEAGTPLWFTTRCIGKGGKLLITTNGNIVPDMSAFDQMASLASQYGGDFGQELARNAAQSILGISTPAETSAEPAKKVEKDESSEEDSDIGDL